MIWLLWLPVTLAAPRVFPLVDPGLFVISGVKTCGGGGGYCLLGLDCTLDEDFLPDDEAGHHCEGLRSAFTPSAHFVCCRATNRSLYKPPLVFPAGLTTAFTETVTGRTTAADVLENEIDQVLLKVAQSVDAIKKTPVTEATEVQTDNQTPEFRESAEDSVEEDSPLEDEDSILDSIENVAQQDLSTEEEDPEASISGGEVNLKIPLQFDKPPITENKPMDSIDSQKPVSALDESENDGVSAEKSTEDNMISTESLSDESASEELELLKNASLLLQTNKNLDETKNKEPIHGDKQENTVGVDSILKENTNTDININKHTNPSKVEDYSENKSSNENLIQNDEAKVSESNGEGISTMNGSEREESVTRRPDLSADIASLKNETNVDSEWVHSKISVTPKSPLENISHDQANSSIVSSKGYNNTVNKTDSKLEKIDNLSNNEKKENSLLENVSKTNSATVDADQSTHAAEDQFVTSTTVSPATHIPDNGRPMSTGQVIQGHPGMAQPCSRGASENCSEEVKFVFQNKTICFGSVYALDWVVTSASCALRVFRAGMLNVSIIPLSGPGRIQVKTIIVHESYGENSGSSGQEMEANNIGLVQLKSPIVQWAECVPCLPLPGQRFSTSNCTAVTSRLLASAPCSTHGVCKSGRDADSRIQMPVCTGAARMMTDDRGFPYIILPCDMVWEPRFAEPSPRGSGAPLFCEGVLAGLETSAGVGMTVYTPLSPYLGWLHRNTRPGLPDQHFNIG